MTGNIVNFRQAKKRARRAKKENHAAENRVKFGRSKAEKELCKARMAKADITLEGHKLTDED